MAVKELHIDINTAMSLCLRNGVKVYPVISGRKFKIQVDNNNKLKTYDAVVDSSKVANAMHKTYVAWAKLILKNKENANSTNS